MRRWWAMALSVLVGCGSGRQVASEPDSTSKAPLQEGLVGTEWRLVDIGGQGALDGAQATLSFPEGGRAVGRASCNQFFGSVTVDRTSIRFASLGTTRMACAGPIMAQEQRFLQTLQAADRFTIANDTLIVHSTDAAMRFVRAR
jgi:heat shock protein HslJ